MNEVSPETAEPSPTPSPDENLSYLCGCCRRLAATYTPSCLVCLAPNAIRPRVRVRSPFPLAEDERVSFPSPEGSDPRQTSGRLLGAAHFAPTPMKPKSLELSRIKIGLGNVDAAFGGGLVQGSAILLSGGEGAGKSTMTLRILEALGPTALYVQSEELQEMVEDRVMRTQCGIGVPLYCSDDIESILKYAKNFKAIIIDSLHGLIGDVDDNSKRILKFCRDSKSIVICIARLVKDGTISGHRTIAYEFDAHLEIEVHEGPGGNGSRFLRGHKNRFGACDLWPLHLSGHGWVDPISCLSEDDEP